MVTISKARLIQRLPLTIDQCAPVVEAEPAHQPERAEQADAGGERTVENTDQKQYRAAEPIAATVTVSRYVFESELFVEPRIDAETQGKQPERDLRQPVRHLQDEAGAGHHARQPGREDEEREAPLERFFPQVPQRDADGERDTEREPKKNQRRKLQQARAAGEGGENIGREGNEKQQYLFEPVHMNRRGQGCRATKAADYGTKSRVSR